MNIILVPTDFSETAKNAAVYAINFAKQMNGKKIILYNTYQSPPVVDVNMALVETVDVNLLKKSSEDNLEIFRQQLQPLCGSEIELTTVSEYGMLSADINDICATYHADVIVMGVTGAGKLTETLIGSYAVDVSRRSQTPVIIVPPGAGYTAIEEIVLACDFTKVAETTPVAAIKNVLNATAAKLFVINIDHNNKHFTPETLQES
ncbi:MAG: universal stress protein, partial [Panacibacter sp.]